MLSGTSEQKKINKMCVQVIKYITRSVKCPVSILAKSFFPIVMQIVLVLFAWFLLFLTKISRKLKQIKAMVIVKSVEIFTNPFGKQKMKALSCCNVEQKR